MRDPKILFYDIETLPLCANVFSLGKQVVRHGQLIPSRNRYEIICIQYMWDTDKKATNLHWIGTNSTSEEMIAKFDAIAKQADILIGKNSDRFDCKHVNTLRLVHGLPPLPGWMESKTKDDVEKQLRRYFYLPSYSLDYISSLLGLGGKNVMEFSDWVDILHYKEALELLNLNVKGAALDNVCMFQYNAEFKEVCRKGKAAHNKMCKYGNKDTEDTKRVWDRIKKYVKPNFNYSHFYGNQTGDYLVCRHCGSSNLIKNGRDMRGSNPKQKMQCADCKGETKFPFRKHRLGKGE
jgi:hypothetical protein